MLIESIQLKQRVGLDLIILVDFDCVFFFCLFPFGGQSYFEWECLGKWKLDEHLALTISTNFIAFVVRMQSSYLFV